MNDPHRGLHAIEPEASREETVRDLLAAAGPRPEPPADDLAAIREAGRLVWRQRHPGPPRRAVWTWLAAAAVAGAVGLSWWILPPGPSPIDTVAHLEVVGGAVSGQADDQPVGRLEVGAGLVAGTQIETASESAGGGRAALRLAGGHSLRLDQGTLARLESATAITLERGRIYFDSGLSGSDAEIAVSTAAGVFRPVGTQFEVEVTPMDGAAETRLRVREGRVSLENGRPTILTGAGEALVVHTDGSLERGVVSRFEGWEWVVATAPRFDLDGRTVDDFLVWVERETGWALQYHDDATAGLAASVTLHGGIDLSPAEAPGAVLASAGFSYQVEDGVLVVTAEP